MAGDDKEKTEEPTSRKLSEARADGNVAVSKEVATFFAFVGSLLLFSFFGAAIMGGMMHYMKKGLSPGTIGAPEFTIESLMLIFTRSSYDFFLIIWPALIIFPLFGIGAYVMQNGFLFSSKALTPKFDKFNPIEGIKKMFSLNSLSELIKSLLKVTVLTVVVYSAVLQEWTTLPVLIDMDVRSSIYFMGDLGMRILVRTIWVLLVIALLDYAFQKWNHTKGLRMSKHEVKEENKETEGDPIVKARIRQAQREMSRQRMMEEVPTADVVVTNPTHIAVAIKYDREEGLAPVVVAMGADIIAEKIKEIAKEHGVPVVENKPLARSLFKMVEVGMEIPVTLYKAVAELLAFVYRSKGEGLN